MDGKLQQIAQKVESLLTNLNSLQSENDQLKQENSQLKTEVGRAEKEFRSLELRDADRSESVRVKLQTILDRLTELEKWVD
ncbi:MAG: hypothetical protein ABIE70_06560 [bacterium]